MNNKISIRESKKEDCPFLLEMIHLLAAFENAPEQVKVTLEQLQEDGFGKSPLYKSFIYSFDGVQAGMSLVYFRYSTWKGKSLYLEDLFIKEEFRQKGIGKAAFNQLAKLAISENCHRFEWQVLDWNTPAINFYSKLGANLDSEWLNVKLEGDEIRSMIEINP